MLFNFVEQSCVIDMYAVVKQYQWCEHGEHDQNYQFQLISNLEQLRKDRATGAKIKSFLQNFLFFLKFVNSAFRTIIVLPSIKVKCLNYPREYIKSMTSNQNSKNHHNT